MIFLDLNLIADIAYAKELFRALIPLKLRWAGLATTTIAWDDELLDLAARSGCRGLLIGFESLNQASLDETKKSFNMHRDYGTVVERVHDRGIAIMGCFVFGFDHDTTATFDETVDFVVDLADRPAALRDRGAVPGHRPLSPPRAGRTASSPGTGRSTTASTWSSSRARCRHELLEGTSRAWKATYTYAGMGRRLIGSGSRLLISVSANLGYRFYAHNLSASTTATGSSRWRALTMRLTLVHPCIGRRRGEPYIRTWQMEPLAPATLAGLTPRDRDTEIRFYDDRMETIPFDEPTDLVAISVETYTAKRAYQIASEYRRRGVPVVMGGFHPTLVPDEVARVRRVDRRRRGGRAVAAGHRRLPRTAASSASTARTRRPSLHGAAARSRDLPGQALPARRAGRGRPRLSLPLRVLRRAVATSASTQTRRPIDDILDEVAAHPQAADLLRRRQHHLEHGAGQGVLPRA